MKVQCLRWFGHVDRMENDTVAKRAYVGVCTGSCSVGSPWKRWIDTVKECRKTSFGCQANKDNGPG